MGGFVIGPLAACGASHATTCHLKTGDFHHPNDLNMRPMRCLGKVRMEKVRILLTSGDFKLTKLRVAWRA